jgi:6-pyruvoyltetrahydropterin/6-carboxytetrahydropterin synthase
MWELTKSFRFEAAHALPGTTLGAASEEIHGHSFRAEITVRGTPDPATGMVLDLGLLQRTMAEVQKMLDHKLLNNVEALGPPTLENARRDKRFQAKRVPACLRKTRQIRVARRWTCP